jgi:anti-sigma B factor antagonist
MQVILGKEGAVTMVKPMGPITASEMEELESRFNVLSRDWTKRVVLNLSEVAFIDSAGLEFLVRHNREFSERGLKLKLSGLSEITEKIMSLTRLIQRFEIYPDTSTAVRSFL